MKITKAQLGKVISEVLSAADQERSRRMQNKPWADEVHEKLVSQQFEEAARMFVEKYDVDFVEDVNEMAGDIRYYLNNDEAYSDIEEHFTYRSPLFSLIRKLAQIKEKEGYRNKKESSKRSPNKNELAALGAAFTGLVTDDDLGHIMFKPTVRGGTLASITMEDADGELGNMYVTMDVRHAMQYKTTLDKVHALLVARSSKMKRRKRSPGYSVYD